MLTAACTAMAKTSSKTDPQIYSFVLDGTRIFYTVTFDRHKSIRLRMKNPELAEIKMPLRTPLAYAEKMLAKHAQWIAAKKQEIAETPALRPLTEELYLFGKALRVVKSPVRRQEKLTFSAQNTYFSQERIFEYALPVLQNGHKQVCLTNAELFACCQGDEEWLKIFAKWRKNTAQAFLSWYCRELWQVFKEQSARFLLQNSVTTDFHKALPPLTVRTCRRCFGSCKIVRRTGETGIMLSAHLMGLPLEYIEFVILHEFCHLIFPNHSPAFYGLFDLVLPRHRILKAGVNAWSKTHNPV